MFCSLMICLVLAGPSMDQVRKDQALAVAESVFAKTTVRDAPQIVGEKRVTSSAMGVHVWLKRSYQEIPIVEARPGVVHLNNGLGVVAQAAPVPILSLMPLALPEPDQLTELVQEIGADHAKAFRLVAKKPFYFVDTAGFVPRLRLVLETGDPSDALWVEVDTRTLQVVNTFAPNLRATGRGKVWRRNPTAAAQGPGYAAALINVDLPDLDGSGYLRGAYVDILGASALRLQLINSSRNIPEYSPGMAYEPDLNFSYTPADLRFEEVSVYYWITAAQHYLQARGYAVRQYPIDVHPHLTPDTNAAYFTGANLIAFGDGFIDTAEDADVVVHEYGHAILDEIVGEAFYNGYGAMFHEGFADFFSYLVNTSLTDEFGPDRYPEYMGELIGGFRPGSPGYTRSLLHPGFKYPYLRNESHEDGQLWSSLFFELSEQFGPDWTMRLLFETLYRASSAQPEELAQLILDVNQTLFAGEHAEQVREALETRGFLSVETGDFARLEVGHELVLESGELWVKFKVDGPPQTLNLQIEPLNSNALYSMILAKNRVPTQAGFDKRVTLNSLPWSTTLAPQGTRPTLDPGATYFLKLDCLRPVRIRLVPSSETLPILPSGTPREVAFASNAAQSFRLTGLANYSRILVDAQLSGPLAYLVSLATEAPYTYEDTPTGGVAAIEVQSGQMLVDLASDFPGADELFLTVDVRFAGFSGTGVLTWTGLGPRNDNPQLALNTANQVELTAHDRDWYFDLATRATAIKITTDASHPFIVSVPGYAPTSTATVQEGVYTVVLDPLHWVLQNGNDLTSFQTEPGRYGITITGGPLGQVPIDLQIVPSATVPSLPDDRHIQRTLLANELVHYQFELPTWARDIRIQQGPLEAGERVRVFLHQREPFNRARLPWQRTLSAERLLYRVSTPYFPLDPEYEDGALFLPGERYDLWFFNPDSSPVNLDVHVSFSAELPMIPDLVDGTTVRIPIEGFDYLQEFEYQVPFHVRPPPGTKRVAFSFDELVGTDEVLLITYGRDQRLIGKPLYQVVLDSYELRFEPEEPFLIFFGFDPHSTFVDTTPASVEPNFRVHVTYYNDTPMDGLLSPEQPVFMDGLASKEPLPLTLDIPEGTRKIDLAWLPTEKPLDARVRFQAQPGGEMPRDLSILDERLNSGRSDFTLSGKTPYQAMAEEIWTVVQTMNFSYDYFVGVFPGAAPFPFKLAARYAELASARDFSTPAAIGSATVETSSYRLVNPSQTSLSATWQLAGQETVVEIPPHGYEDLAIPPGNEIHVAGTGPLLVFQAMSGAGWFSLAGTPAYRASSYLLPHVSPDASDWNCYLDSSQAGETALRLTHLDQSEPIQPGLTLLGNDQNSSKWFGLSAGLTQDGLFPEETVSATQLWQNGTQVVQDFPRSKGARTHFVPHLPDHPAWWSGLVLSNLSEQECAVTIRAFASGRAVPKVLNLTLAPGETLAGLMDQFVPEGYATTTLSWMRIEANQDITAQAFIGAYANEDTAGFALTDKDGLELVFPGSLHEGNHGWAVVNTVNQPGSIEVRALDSQGQEIAALTRPLQAYERWLFLPSTLGLAPDQSYTLRVSTSDLRLVGLQLDVSGTQLAGETAQVIE